MQSRNSDSSAKKKFEIFVADNKESHGAKSWQKPSKPGPIIRSGSSSGVSIVGQFGTLDCSIGRIFRDEFGKNLKMPKTNSDIELGRSLSVLIIDDSLVHRKLTQRTLGGLINEVMWMVEGVQNGECALNLMESSPRVPDVIIVDQYMETTGGHLLGHEVVAELRRNSAFDSAVIIGCTGSIDKAKPQFLESGCDAVWSKPMPSKDEAQAEILRLVKERKSTGLLVSDSLPDRSSPSTGSGMNMDGTRGFSIGSSGISVGSRQSDKVSQSSPPRSPPIQASTENSYFIATGESSGSVFQFGAPTASVEKSTDSQFVKMTEGISNIQVKE